MSHIHSTNLCQEMEFSVLALNIVGRGTKSTIHIAPREGMANHINLTGNLILLFGWRSAYHNNYYIQSQSALPTHGYTCKVKVL